MRRSEDGGDTWGDTITVGRGWQAGGSIVDETSGNVLVFIEDKHPPAPLTVYRSKDSGRTWAAQKTVIRPDANGNVPSMHMNEHGITLRRGKHAGRLIRPARHYGKSHDPKDYPTQYTTAIYSDDGGKTWDTSKPFAEAATGEACIVELADGRLYYNSRSHWNAKKPPKRRRCAWSDDGGETWRDWQVVQALPDGPQNSGFGCMGGLTRLPVRGRDIVLYSNSDSTTGRNRGTVWASFDGGKTWPLKRLVFEGAFSYSSLNVGRPGTKTEGLVYLLFEGGPKGGGTMARFNLSWLLAGKQTGDGDLPAWITSVEARPEK
ncbi:MAG: sialidase family protein [Planctomycetota bacterium]